jgi:hypothetical protein
MPVRKPISKEKPKKNGAIKRSKPEGTLDNFFGMGNAKKKIRTNDNPLPEDSKSSNFSGGLNLNTKLNFLNNPNGGTSFLENHDHTFLKIPIKPTTNNIFNQETVRRLKGTRFIDNCSPLKQVAEMIISDLNSKYKNLSEKWINDQFGLCLRGVLCSKKGKLFSSKYQPKRTVELLDIKTTDRVVSWLCGFVEERKAKNAGNSFKSSMLGSSEPSFSGQTSSSSASEKKTVVEQQSKGSLPNFFGKSQPEKPAGPPEGGVGQTGFFSKPSNSPIPSKQNPSKSNNQ